MKERKKKRKKKRRKERIAGVYIVQFNFGRLVPYIKPCFECTFTAGVATLWWV
jgi:hypothetical protein